MAEIQANVMDIREFVNIQVQQKSKCMKYSNPVVVQAQYENSAAAALDRCKEFLSSGKFSMVRQVLCCTVLYFTVLYCTVLYCVVLCGRATCSASWWSTTPSRASTAPPSRCSR